MLKIDDRLFEFPLFFQFAMGIINEIRMGLMMVHLDQTSDYKIEKVMSGFAQFRVMLDFLLIKSTSEIFFRKDLVVD